MYCVKYFGFLQLLDDTFNFECYSIKSFFILVSKAESEERTLSYYSPLKTILILSSGPLLAQLVEALYGVIGSFWVSRTIGEEGITVYGAVNVIDFLPYAVSNMLSAGICIRIAYLFGEGKREECSQVFCDFLRIAVIAGLVLPAIVLPSVKPLIKWFGSDDHIANKCFQYMIPSTCGSTFNNLYLCACGLLQACGHPYLYGFMQVLTCVLSGLVFDPILLVWLKLPIWSASLASILAQTISAGILLIMTFCGKLSINPELKMLIKKPSRESWMGFKLSISSFLGSLGYFLPIVVIQKYINQAANRIGKYNVIMAIWGINEKINQIVGAFCGGFQTGLVPGCSYAFGAKRLNRMVRIFFHSLWIPTIIVTLISVVLIFAPDKVSSIWSKDPEFLHWSKILVPRIYYLTFLFPIQYVAVGFIMSMQRERLAAILSFISYLFPLPIYSSVLYYSKKNDPARIFYSYPLMDITASIIFVIAIISPVRKALKEPKDELLTKNSLLNNEELKTAPLITVD